MIDRLVCVFLCCIC